MWTLPVDMERVYLEVKPTSLGDWLSNRNVKDNSHVSDLSHRAENGGWAALTWELERRGRLGGVSISVEMLIPSL